MSRDDAGAEPPEFLYYAATAAALPALMIEGILDRSGGPVQLFVDAQAAKAAAPGGARAVILKINAWLLQLHGFELSPTPSGVWLAERVPIQYFEV